VEQYEVRVADRREVGKGCGALRILEVEDDFRNEVSHLELSYELMLSSTPMFNCKLNYIKYYWAALKRYTRENCEYSFQELEATVLKGMDFVKKLLVPCNEEYHTSTKSV